MTACPHWTSRSIPLDRPGGPQPGRQVEAGGSGRDGSRPPSTEELLAATAHDLRLPLSHIKGFVSSLRRDDLEWDAATRRDFLAEIELEADRLAQMLDALLQSRAPGAGSGPAANMAFTDPASIVTGALHRTRGLLGERPLRVEVA